MAPATSLFVEKPTEQTPPQASKRVSVKTLVESPGLTSIPSKYSYSLNPNESAGSEPDETIPTIDFSLLTSGDPHQRSKIIRDLDKACREWGFFMLVNHGVSKSLMKEVLDGCNQFFNLPMEEKMGYEGKDIWKPIRFGTGVDVKVEEFFFWRDFLKVYVHPQFNFPNKPEGFSEVAQEYSKRTREVIKELLKGVSESLGFEQSYIEKAMNLESDHGLLTLLIENEIGGLQIQHNGKWFNVNPLPNSFLVNTGDHLEILSNGRYKSIKHRAVVNNKSTRITIPVPLGPSLDTVVSPAPELLEGESGCPAAYLPMKHKDYMDRLLEGKPCLDHVRLPVA
ncbi:hypothetical protein Vadar_029655 [Vaccinium darrowii]|uniref:Uncharacterized protein n=1 Tax=Vaccinium darrowii TaxID=229202 RepID=A0ACB7Y369_9ERIC|nr:hypothetical protein Vadar_029655 [Vaccinium darrowii]